MQLNKLLHVHMQCIDITVEFNHVNTLYRLFVASDSVHSSGGALCVHEICLRFKAESLWTKHHTVKQGCHDMYCQDLM